MADVSLAANSHAMEQSYLDFIVEEMSGTGSAPGSPSVMSGPEYDAFEALSREISPATSRHVGRQRAPGRWASRATPTRPGTLMPACVPVLRIRSCPSPSLLDQASLAECDDTLTGFLDCPGDFAHALTTHAAWKPTQHNASVPLLVPLANENDFNGHALDRDHEPSGFMPLLMPLEDALLNGHGLGGDTEDEEIDVETVQQRQQQVPHALEIEPSKVSPAAHDGDAFAPRSSLASVQRSKRKAGAVSGAASPMTKQARVLSSHSRHHAALSPEDADARRTIHNVLERRRRDELKVSFEELRTCVPGLDQARTPKMVILERATGHVAAIRERERTLHNTKARLLAEKQQLLDRLSALRRGTTLAS